MAESSPSDSSLNSKLSALSTSDKPSRSGRAIPVQFVLSCIRESQLLKYMTLDVEDRDLTEPPLGCRRGNHGVFLHTTTCLLRLPLTAERQLLQIQREVVRLFRARESDLRRVIEMGMFKDHELYAIEIGVACHTSGLPLLPCTWLGGAYTVDSTRLASVEDEAYDVHAERFDGVVEKAFEVLERNNWQGHLVAVCYLKGPASRLMTSREGSVVGEDEFSEESERVVLGPPDLEFPD